MDSVISSFTEVFNKTTLSSFERSHALAVANHLSFVVENQEVPAALLAAALFHDIDRSVPVSVQTKNCSDDEYAQRKLLHAARSAYVATKLLRFLDESLLDDIFFLISRHETGGDTETRGDLLFDFDTYTKTYNLHEAANSLYWADKLAFFSQSIHEYAQRERSVVERKIRYSLQHLPRKVLNKILSFTYPEEISSFIKEEIAGISKRIRQATRAVILCGEEVLLIKHKGADYWNLPGGGLEEGELVQEAIVRELHEELGLQPDDYEVLGMGEKEVFEPARPINGWHGQENQLVVVRLNPQARVVVDGEEVTEYKLGSLDEMVFINLREAAKRSVKQFTK
ncbi:MAG: NUDIX hydrolase [Candidatus Woesearchaeota archaeon]